MQDRRIIAAIAFVAISILSDANANDVSSVQHGQEAGHQVDAAQTAKSLVDDVIVWISANFDLPAKSDRPQIRFVTQTEMMRIRIADRMRWRGFVQEEPAAEKERNVVAIYDTSSRTIYLPEDWRGESPSINLSARDGPPSSESRRGQIRMSSCKGKNRLSRPR
jgi:hypothetical protein